MRSVRCDVCGTKALMAASKCPKCSHAFEVRDGFGEMLPLSHCASCDSYYPTSLGGCRWCGTKPERSTPIGPYVWKAFGALTFASLAIGAWLIHNEDTSSTKPVRTFVADTLPTNQPPAESFGRKVVVAKPDSSAKSDSTSTAPLADSTNATTVALGGTDTAQPRSTTVVRAASEPIQSAGTVAQPEPVSVDSSASVPPAPPPTTRVATRVPVPERVVAPAPARTPDRSAPRAVAKAPDRTAAKPSLTRSTVVRPPARVVAKAPARTAPAPKTTTRSPSGRWVTTVARNWAVVRSNPSRESRIVAAIGPNTRVQLGETKGQWRRIKAKGLAGWVEHRVLLARVSSPKKTGRLAAR